MANIAQPEEARPSPFVIEDQMLVIKQLRHAFRGGDSVAITKVVRHILHS